MLVSKKLSRVMLATVICMAVAFLIAFIFVLKFQRPIKDDLKKNDTQEQNQVSSSGLPVRLKIPAIEVDAAVEQVGLTPAGAMDTPKGPADVAWFNLGQRPGGSGTAVIAGHYGTWKNGSGSVFDNLHKLHVGDKIYMEDDKGATVTFAVREIRNYDPQADAAEVFSSNDEQSHLNLITCKGAWNKDAKSYSQRLVVFADKEQ
ncbi:MAG TPA: class F sortase [Patescibacteria group bacterium]